MTFLIDLAGLLAGSAIAALACFMFVRGLLSDRRLWAWWLGAVLFLCIVGAAGMAISQ